jgi:hypothetical protein
MVYSPPPNRLSSLQRDLLAGFFAREQRFYLTGGGALAGFYFGHRTSEDLDLFSPPGPSLADADHVVRAAATACSATCEPGRTFPEFRRLHATRGEDTCIVDLVIDRAPAIDPEKAAFGPIRVDTLREIAANKICTLIGRSEIKDFVDLQQLLASGIELEAACDDAQRKDRGADPATLAWVLNQVTIGPTALLPGEVDPVGLSAFRGELVKKLRELAMRQARRA